MTIVVAFDSMGPYHVARLNDLSRHYDVLGLEYFATSSEYDWRFSQRANFTTTTLFKTLENPFRTFLAIREALKISAAEAVFVPGWGSRCALLTILAARSLRLRTFLMSDSQEIDAPRNSITELFKRYVISQCSGALVAGAPHFDYIVKLGIRTENVAMGYDVVDNKFFLEGANAARDLVATSSQHINLPDRYFLVVARLVEKKNLVTLIRAYAKFFAGASSDNNNNRPWSLVFVGEGPLLRELTALAEALLIKEHVHFVGQRTYEELPTIYGLAEALILPSSTDQWGLVVNEAMAAGLPVLVSDRCGCVSDLVQDGLNGYSFSPQSEQDLELTLEKIFRLEPKEKHLMGQASQKRIAQWSLDRFSRSIDTLVNNATERSDSPRAGSACLTIILGCLRGRT